MSQDDTDRGDRSRAFLRFAREAVVRLVDEPEVARELISTLDEPEPTPDARDIGGPPDEGERDEGARDALHRVLRGQQVLARILGRERIRGGAAASLLAGAPADLLAREHLGFERQIRVIYELEGVGTAEASGASWNGLRRVDPRRMSEDLRQWTLDPVLRALRTLVQRRWRHRHAAFRRAAARAAVDPLGFSRLVLEEADALGEIGGEGAPSPLAYVIRLLDDPWLRRVSPTSYSDLHARARLYQADRHRRAGRRQDLDEALEEAGELLERGSGDADLRALYFETRAAAALLDGEGERARRHFLRAALYLGQDAEGDEGDLLPPVDRRVEVLLKYALLLASDPASRRAAPPILESLVGLLAQQDLGIHPGLRLRVHHALARTLLDLARQQALRAASAEGASEDERLDAAADDGGDGETEPDQTLRRLAALARGLRSREPLLWRARAWLRMAEPLYADGLAGATAQMESERLRFLGLSYAADEPSRAAELLHEAVGAYRRLDDEEGQSAALRDLLLVRLLSLPEARDTAEVRRWAEEIRLELARHDASVSTWADGEAEGEEGVEKEPTARPRQVARWILERLAGS